MLTHYKQKYIYFFLLVLKLICYTGNLLCTESDIQKKRLTTKYADYLYNPNNKETNRAYNRFAFNIEEKRHLTSYSSSDNSNPWSNAFNFKKGWGATVDPRTGILSTWVKTGSMLSNLGHGPDINLNINYNSNTVTNLDGLGKGWNWNLTHFNPATHQLITSFGQNFYLKKRSNGHWQPMYHKLHDILIQGDISTHFVITYANGLRETLNHEGYETLLEQQDGWSVRFSYLSGTHLLESVRDDAGHIIKLHRISNYLSVISQGSYGQPVIVLINKKNSEIHSITLPLFNNHAEHGIYFYYLQHFMTGIEYPTGLKNRIIYNCSDQIKVPENYTLSVHALCAVIKEITDPGFGQPIMISRYRYGKSNINEHNYLGFNVGLNITDNSLKDRLFEAPVSYTYQTEQDNGLIREVRTYNKYHLMTDEKQVSDRTEHILSAVHYFFCRTDQYDGCAHSSFADLPVTYSLPLKIITRVFGETTETPATTTMTTRYDKQGRIIWQKDIYGRVTINSYCPLNGDTVCPAASTAWPFITLNKFTVQYPADSGIKTSPLPVITRNYYRKEINHNGKGYIAVLDHQTAQSGNQQITTTRYYYQNTEDLLTYGLLKKMVMTGQLNETNSDDTMIKDYYYVKSSDNSTKTTYSAVELSENKRLFSSYITTSLFSNQVLMITDAEKKDRDRYDYDPWDRPVRTENAVGTDFSASTYYSYIVSKNLNQVLITTVNGLQQKVIFDSTGRIIKNFTETIDKTGKKQPGLWLPVQKIHYDKYGRIARQSNYVIDESGHVTTLDTTQDYDDTGRAVRIHLPDGRMNVMHYDDSDRCVISYQQNRQGEHAVISVSRANILSKPIKQWILPATNVLSSSVKSLCLNSDKQPEARISLINYDGFGRQIQEQDPEGRIVKQYYDSLGRLTDIVDPAGNRTHSVYNLIGQVIQSWVYPVSGGHYLLSSIGYNRAGQLIWKAGEDGKQTVYTYTPDGQIATITTPNRHIFSWQYNRLNLPVQQLTDNQQQWSAYYDTVTLKIQKKADITGIKTYSYSDDGLIQQLNFIGKSNYSDYKIHWEYDNNRRTISTTDISGNRTHIRYDGLGRVAHINYHPYKNNSIKTLSVFSYDHFSRIKQINYGSGMHRTFHYDPWGHKDQITDTLREQLVSQWKIIYDISDNIILLSQKAEKEQTGIQHYHYDVLDNLVSMQCQGSSSLPLCPHDISLTGSKLTEAPVITHQGYTFTPLNRLASVRETLQSVQQQQTINKIIRYHYTDVSVPLRLQNISTTWSRNKPFTQSLTYDDVGNMTVDGQNNHITYNLLNEVTSVISSTGKQSDYRYDSSGQEVMEKSSYGMSFLFYCGGILLNEKITSPEQDTHITGYLGVAKTTDGIISEYYENSYKGDVSGIFKRNNKDQYQFQQRNIYSPYGMVWHKTSKTRPLYQQTLQGFDGERTDAATGWQFLGAGNRTYNPAQRYFLSEDPAGNGYAFGSNNPIMNTDPSGNSPEWLGEVFKWAGYVSTMGLGALHQRWVNITAAVMQAGCTVATLGAAVAGAGSAALAGVVAGTAAVGSIPVVAAAMPANKGLNIAGKIIGMAEMAVSVAAAAIDLTPLAIKNDSMKIHIPLRMLLLKGELAVDDVQELAATNNSFSDIFKSDILNFVNFGLSPLDDAHDISFSSVSNFLKISIDYYEADDNGFLNLTSEAALQRTWNLLLISPFADNIQCDTGVILLAHHITQEPLFVNGLEDFLNARNKCPDCFVNLKSDNDYFKALKNALFLVKARHYGFMITNGDAKLADISRNCYQHLVVVGYEHMVIIQRLPVMPGKYSTWNTYIFYSDGNINTQVISAHTLKALIPHPDYPNKLHIYAYLRLKK